MHFHSTLASSPPHSSYTGVVKVHAKGNNAWIPVLALKEGLEVPPEFATERQVFSPRCMIFVYVFLTLPSLLVFHTVKLLWRMIYSSASLPVIADFALML